MRATVKGDDFVGGFFHGFSFFFCSLCRECATARRLFETIATINLPSRLGVVTSLYGFGIA